MKLLYKPLNVFVFSSMAGVLLIEQLVSQSAYAAEIKTVISLQCTVALDGVN
jgi:hypothetical protein